jgi:predicted small metal-binding protein
VPLRNEGSPTTECRRYPFGNSWTLSRPTTSIRAGRGTGTLFAALTSASKSADEYSTIWAYPGSNEPFEEVDDRSKEIDTDAADAGFLWAADNSASAHPAADVDEPHELAESGRQPPTHLVARSGSDQETTQETRRPREGQMRELRCSDAGFDCDAVIRGESDEEVFAQAAPHAKDVHGVDVTPELQQQLAGLIRET